MEPSSTRPADLKEREQPDNVSYSDDNQSTASNTSGKGARSHFAGRARESSLKSPSKLRGPVSLTCCTLAGDGRPRNCVWRASRDGACFGGPPIPDTNVQAANANGRIARETGSLKSNLSFQAFRIMDELSRVWGWAADKLSSQPTWTAAGGPSVWSKSPPKMPTTESLYIFSPHQYSSACYLYRSDDGGSNDPYEFDHITR